MIIPSWRDAARSLLCPRRHCLICGELVLDEILCPECANLNNNRHRCSVCATFVPSTETEHYRCNICRGMELPYTKAVALLEYDIRCREILLRFKYRGRSGLYHNLGRLMAELFYKEYAHLHFDTIVPIPLYYARLETRGYDHSLLLADKLSYLIHIPVQPQALKRVKDTPALWSLTHEQRYRALANAFTAADTVRDKTVLLTDDIFTTGATACAAAKALLKAGAKEIYVLTLAGGVEET